jgi:hypothetical protein
MRNPRLKRLKQCPSREGQGFGVRLFGFKCHSTTHSLLVGLLSYLRFSIYEWEPPVSATQGSNLYVELLGLFLGQSENSLDIYSD